MHYVGKVWPCLFKVEARAKTISLCQIEPFVRCQLFHIYFTLISRIRVDSWLARFSASN